MNVDISVEDHGPIVSPVVKKGVYSKLKNMTTYNHSFVRYISLPLVHLHCDLESNDVMVHHLSVHIKINSRQPIVCDKC